MVHASASRERVFSMRFCFEACEGKMYSNNIRALRDAADTCSSTLRDAARRNDYNGYNGASNAFAVLNPPASQ
jgi:hypothetical protein